MLKPMLRAAALLAVALIPPASASAADDDAKLVESLPPEVADVVTGGSWSEGKQGGFYRAIVVDKVVVFCLQYSLEAVFNRKVLKFIVNRSFNALCNLYPVRQPEAWLIPAARVDTWLEELAGWDVPLSELSLRVLPSSGADSAVSRSPCASRRPV